MSRFHDAVQGERRTACIVAVGGEEESLVRTEPQRWGALGGTRLADRPRRPHQRMRYRRLPIRAPDSSHQARQRLDSQES